MIEIFNCLFHGQCVCNRNQLVACASAGYCSLQALDGTSGFCLLLLCANRHNIPKESILLLTFYTHLERCIIIFCNKTLRGILESTYYFKIGSSQRDHVVKLLRLGRGKQFTIDWVRLARRLAERFEIGRKQSRWNFRQYKRRSENAGKAEVIGDDGKRL